MFVTGKDLTQQNSEFFKMNRNFTLFYFYEIVSLSFYIHFTFSYTVEKNKYKIIND